MIKPSTSMDPRGGLLELIIIIDGSPRSLRWARALLSGAQGSQNAQFVILGYTEVPAENSNRIGHRKGSPTSKLGPRQVHQGGGRWTKPIENSVMFRSSP